nr:probable LRR receptor-like serine/threonine-protein kinase At4g29180 [Ziziphus jujuba var. spinosa]
MPPSDVRFRQLIMIRIWTGLDGQNHTEAYSSERKKEIVVVALLSSGVAFILALLVIWILRRVRKSKAEMNKKAGKIVETKKIQFSHEEVLEITNNLEKVIGKGGFGTVYHGCMKNGKQVAVKMLSLSTCQGYREFQMEAELSMRTHHRNLVAFVGYCDDADDRLALIYEYMANGNLKRYLSERSRDLSWEKRLRIAIDAAQGLEYLHHGCNPPVVHRDVKTANILLTQNLDAKIADFGLSKLLRSNEPTDHVTNLVMGTVGYLDPEYRTHNRLNEKSDVYSFGVVLLELITGQTAVIKSNSEHFTHIKHWVVPRLQQGDIARIVDCELKASDFEVESVRKALQVAMACTNSISIRRPTMDSVLAELKLCLEKELSRNIGDQKSRARPSTEEMFITTAAPSDDEVRFRHSDHSSMNAESMTAPFAR